MSKPISRIEMQTASANAKSDHSSDDEVVQRVLAGEHAAFEILMRRYNRMLFRTARSILKDDVEAEDALQDAYLLAYRGLTRFRGDSSLATWLTRIVINSSLARRRQNVRRAEIIDITGLPLAGEEGLGVSMEDAVADRPEEAASRMEACRLLEKKIDALPDIFRTVFMLRALEEMTVEETAACLQIPEATVRTRYFRARSMLREALAQEIDLAFDNAFGFDGQRCDRIVERTMARISNFHIDEADNKNE
jgi:RNA polymerase sigma-70 factor (ECF subfamily)